MAFATDKDLLTFEPALFRDIGWIGQRLVAGQGSASGTALTMTSQDVGFDAAAVGTGNVVLINGASYEVVDRVSASVLTISRLRGSADDPLLSVGSVSGAEVSVPTFGPQIAMVHRHVLRMIGIEPDLGLQEGQVGESAIVNPSALTNLETLGSLHLVYSGASSAMGPEAPLAKKAEFYRLRFCDERQRTVAMIDLDGDGEPDAMRRFNVFQLTRG